MKQLNLMFYMVLLLQVGVIAQNHEFGPIVAQTNALSPSQQMQQITDTKEIGITGQVTNENGEPFIGATVVVKGTTTGTITDIDGNYAINVPDENSILIFSSVGYVTKEVSVGSRTVVNVVLEPGVSELEEVVVTAL